MSGDTESVLSPGPESRDGSPPPLLARNAATDLDSEAQPSAPDTDKVLVADEEDTNSDVPSEEGYSKNAVDKMTKAIERVQGGLDLTFADGLPVDEHGYRPITWTQLRHVFSYERPASGFKLVGDISQKQREHWERGKQIKIRDADGVEGAVFFYDDDSKKGGFDWEDIEIGNTIAVRSPRYHRFLDGQEGMRIESCEQVMAVKTVRFSDHSRIDYGTLNKQNGNKKFKAGRYEKAIECYDAAIKHLEGTFHEVPSDEQQARELVASCYLNIAACHVAEKMWRAVELPCRSALRISATPALNAKAHFRMGQACRELQEYTPAREHLDRAAELVPGDAAVECERQRLTVALQQQCEADKTLFRTARELARRRFGLKRQMLADVPTALDGVPNFRDVGGKITADGARRVKRHVLYRCGNLAACTRGDMDQLTSHLGLKTIVDLRSQQEVRLGLRRLKRQAQRRVEEAAICKKSDEAAERLARQLDTEAVDYCDFFSPVTVTFGKPSAALPVDRHAAGVAAIARSVSRPTSRVVRRRAPPATTDAEALDGRVALQMDMSSLVVWPLASWWTVLLAGAAALFFFIPAMLDLAFRIVFRGTCVRVGLDGTYDAMATHGAAVIREAVLTVAAESNHPVMLSCSLGKDRTGLVVAVLLAAVGVPDEAVVADYAASVVPAAYRAAQEAQGAPASWNEADPDTMRRFLSRLRLDYGGVDEYLLAIGVTPEQLAALCAALTAEIPARLRAQKAIPPEAIERARRKRLLKERKLRRLEAEAAAAAGGAKVKLPPEDVEDLGVSDSSEEERKRDILTAGHDPEVLRAAGLLGKK